jgi:hypothetical protein
MLFTELILLLKINFALEQAVKAHTDSKSVALFFL